MVRVEIANVRGARSVSLDIEGFTIVAGDNYAGKTSIAEAIQACLSGTAPRGFKKKEIEEIVSDGTKHGAIAVAFGDSRVRLTLPDLAREAKGPPVTPDDVAYGSVDPLVLADWELAKLLGRVTETHPTRQAFDIALDDVLSADHRNELWAMIEKSGWDFVHNSAKEKATKAKGKWEHVSKQKRWGAQVGEAFGAEERDQNRAALAKAHELALAAHAEASKLVILSDADAEAATGAAAEVAAREADLAAAQHAFDVAYAAGTPDKPLIDSQCVCPHCRKPFFFRSYEGGRNDVHAEMFPPIPPGPNTQSLRDELGAAKRRLASAQEASQKLQESAGRPRGTVDQVSAAKAALDAAQIALAAHDTAVEAYAIHEEIKARLAVIECLAPTGLRQEAMILALKAVNQRLAELSECAGWGLISIDEEMVPRIGGRHWRLCSESELMRIRMTLQMLFAQAGQGPQIVVIDRADMLDKAGLNGLLDLASSAPDIAVLTLMTWRDGPLDLPDVADRTYWIANGASMPIDEARKAIQEIAA